MKRQILARLLWQMLNTLSDRIPLHAQKTSLKKSRFSEWRMRNLRLIRPVPYAHFKLYRVYLLIYGVVCGGKTKDEPGDVLSTPWNNIQEGLSIIKWLRMSILHIFARAMITRISLRPKLTFTNILFMVIPTKTARNTWIFKGKFLNDKTGCIELVFLYGKITFVVIFCVCNKWFDSIGF